MPETTAYLPAVIAAFALAGLVKGVSGLGLPTVSIGVLSLIMTPAEAAALVVAPSLATNVWQMVSGPALARLIRRLWPMMTGVCLGAWLSAGLLIGSDGRFASAALGAALVLYAAFGLSPVRLPRVSAAAEPFVGPIVGIATGVVTGATGVFVIPAVPYLQALDLGREDLVQALGLSFTVSTVALAAALASGGGFGVQVAWISLLALAPALVGMMAGQWVRRAVRPEVFRRCFFAALALLGGHLMLAGLL